VRLSDFHYDLPEELIAQQPLPCRDASRMMVVRRNPATIEHRCVRDLPDLLAGNETVVVNNSRVIPARMWARKESGGEVELLVVRLHADRFEAMTRCSKPLRAGQPLTLERTGKQVVVASIPEPGRALLACGSAPLPIIQEEGSIPLPPYIRRDRGWDEHFDRERYQTVYARPEGSVAAPTAGLHFTPELLEHVRARGCTLATLTLHVGPGTFQPVRTENVEEHRMEEERFSVSEATAAAVNRSKAEGRPVLAVGTTSVRCLESAGSSGRLVPGEGATSLFIRPGHEFRMVDRMLTNFHLPGSTLILLVAALAGRDFILDAYREAVREKYRFYSYGDCMLIL